MPDSGRGKSMKNPDGSVLRLSALTALIIIAISQATFAPMTPAWSVSGAKPSPLSNADIFSRANPYLSFRTSINNLNDGFPAPSGIGRWSTNGPRDSSGGIGVSSVALDPTNPSIIYAGGALDSRIFKTSDNGTNWRLAGTF